MTRTVEAIFENGVFRPLEPLPELSDGATVHISVDVPVDRLARLRRCAGILPAEDAAEMLRVIEAEFERIDEREWQ